METFQKSVELSKKIQKDLDINPNKYRILTGERPTGNLHIGHYFGSLIKRIELQKKNIEMFILIANYQVLTDHESCNKISQFTKELIKDYIAAGIDFNNEKTFVFPHSHIPELNQLLIPFSTLVTMSELERNPTVKEEIKSSQLANINVGMFIYPIHQAADILSVNANLVPVGKDQLPHLELSRIIAKRFNNKFCKDNPFFNEPNALLSETPSLVGLDGKQKMSKSRNNTIMLKFNREEIIEVVKKAVTDSDKNITFDPINRPEVANLLTLCSIMSPDRKSPEDIAKTIGNNGSKLLKEFLIENTDNFLKPFRERRNNVTEDYINKILKLGIEKIRDEATKTLTKVIKLMNMQI